CFIESETMYSAKGEVPSGEHLVPLGVAEVKRPGSDVTVITWGKMVHVSLEAAATLAGEGIAAEVLDLRTIRPLDVEAIVASVRRTHRCLVVQEGWPFASVATEVVTTGIEEAFDELDAPPARRTSRDAAMPHVRTRE